MPPFSVRSRRTIDRHVDRLESRFEDVPVETRTVENDPAFFEHGVELFEAGHLGGAAAWVYDDAGRVLLMRDPRAPDRWSIPGGGHEAGESFVETAEREVWEEVGVDATVTGVWHVVRKRYVHEDDPARRGYLLETWFDARYEGGEAGLYPSRWDEDADESVLEVRWFESRPDELTDMATRRADDWEWSDG